MAGKRTHLQPNKSILPTFVLSKVGISYAIETHPQCKARTCKLKTQKINVNNETHPTYPTHPKLTAYAPPHHPLPPSANSN